MGQTLLARVVAVIPTETFVTLNCFVKADPVRQLLPPGTPARVDKIQLLSDRMQ
jgi:hypothetical protein